MYICHVQLCLGVSDRNYTAEHPVYLCLGGTGRNEIFIVYKVRLYTFTVQNLRHMHLNQALRKLLTVQRDLEV